MRSVHPRFEKNTNFAFEKAATANSIDEVAQAKNGSTHTNLPNSSTTSESEKVAGSIVKTGDELVPAFKSRLASRVQSASGFTLKHTDTEIKAILQKGKDLNLADDVIDDMLFISCRDAKQIGAADLMTQMDNYVNVVLKQGHPYKFSDIGQFNTFKNELKTGLNDIGVSTSDVRIQGSALRTPNANDVDMVAVISKDEFDDVLKSFYNGKVKKNGVEVDMTNMNSQQLKDLSDDISRNPSSYNGIAKSDFNYNYTKQIINAKPDKGVIDGLKNLKDNLQLKYPNLNIENIAIQTSGGMFDLKPFMKL